MINRPLPAIPPSSDVGQAGYDHRASPKLRNWTSLDDDVIPHHSRSTLGARMRDSPKRRPQRPQSEVILDSKLSAYSGNLGDQPGVYIYGFKSQTQNELSRNCNGQNNHMTSINISPTHTNRPVQFNQRDSFLQQYTPKVNNADRPMSPKGTNSLQTGYDNAHSLQNGNSSPPIHFQNGGTSSNPVDNVPEINGTPKKEKTGGGYVHFVFVTLENLVSIATFHAKNAAWIFFYDLHY